jgi:hypothetical protein
MLIYFTFLYCYSVLSCIGLIKDLFLQQYSIAVYDPDVIVKNYESIFERNLYVVTYGLVPFFIFLEIVYYMSSEYSYFLGLLQAVFCFYTGYILHRMVCINYRSRNVDFDRYNKNNTFSFIFRMCNKDLREVYTLYIVPMYAPLIFIGANKLAYDIIFVLFMVSSTLLYSNNQTMVLYFNEMCNQLKLDYIDDKLDSILESIRTEYVKFINKNKRTMSTKINEDIRQDDYEEVNEDEIDSDNLEQHDSDNLEQHNSDNLEHHDGDNLEQYDGDNLEQHDGDNLEQDGDNLEQDSDNSEQNTNNLEEDSDNSDQEFSGLLKKSLENKKDL